jgi:hypothetical protein
MMTLLQYLESFNRKERFFLIGDALGNPAFQLSDDFRAKLNTAFGIHPPSNAFAAMDYHLDWIHASMFLSLPENDEEAVHENKKTVATGNQEDADLLVAFEQGDIIHLMLVEAKAETGWTNKQMCSKAKRLRRIFGDDGTNYPKVKPHFGLMSPRRPQQRKSSLWPVWMTRDGESIWCDLKVPCGGRKITRCDQCGRPSATGEFFRALKC